MERTTSISFHLNVITWLCSLLCLSMAGKSRGSKLILSDEDRAELEQLSRSRTLPHREAQRAAIILRYYGGESITCRPPLEEFRRTRGRLIGLYFNETIY